MRTSRLYTHDLDLRIDTFGRRGNAPAAKRTQNVIDIRNIL
jgi:hypothetical protein